MVYPDFLRDKVAGDDAVGADCAKRPDLLWSEPVGCNDRHLLSFESEHYCGKVFEGVEALAGSRKDDVWPAAEQEHRRVDVVHRRVVYYAHVLDVERHPVFAVELDHHRVAVHAALYQLPSVTDGRIKALDVA